MYEKLPKKSIRKPIKIFVKLYPKYRAKEKNKIELNMTVNRFLPEVISRDAPRNLEIGRYIYIFSLPVNMIFFRFLSEKQIEFNEPIQHAIKNKTQSNFCQFKTPKKSNKIK